MRIERFVTGAPEGATMLSDGQVSPLPGRP